MHKNETVIDVAGLTKRFGSFQALNELDLTVNKGEVHGFLGPNGAGKSTTIRILLGLVQATAGTVRLFGKDPWHNAAQLHSRLAYVPGDVTLWPGLTGGQCIDILGRAHGGVDPKRRNELIERFDLDPKKRTRDYSKGNRQKVSLVSALAADTELLILDEPTSGLDPLMEEIFQQVVRERKEEGTTVLLSSHILAEVEALADRVSIIREGVTVTTGSLTELRRHTKTHIHAVLDTSITVPTGGEHHTLDDGGVDVRFSVEPLDVPGVIETLHRAGIRSLTVAPPSLDELFLSSYAGGDTDAA